MHRPAHFIGTLATALGAAAVLLALPAWLRFGPLGLEGLAYAALAALIPGVLLAGLAGRFTGTQRALQLLLTGTALRVGSVLLVGVAAAMSRPGLQSAEFFLALAVFYFIALAVETRQLLVDVAAERRTLAELAPSSPRQPQSH